MNKRGRYKISTSWLQTFEEKYNLKYYEPDQMTEGVAFFENSYTFTWFIQIDQNSNTITFANNFKFSMTSEKEVQIVNELLENMSDWETLKLFNKEEIYEISSVETDDFRNKYHYKIKESLNAFGNYDWGEI